MAGLEYGQLLITYIAVSVGIINVCLMMGLIYSYGRTYQEVKSGFTIGLLYFASLILIQNVFITLFLAAELLFPPTIVTSIADIHEPVKPLFFINLIQLIALSILFRLTRE